MEPGLVERLLAWFLGQTAIVSVVVSALKRYPFVRSHPKLTAAVLNTVVIFAADFLYGIIPGSGLDDVLVKFLTAVAASFGSSGFYEQVVKPGVTIVMPPKS